MLATHVFSVHECDIPVLAGDYVLALDPRWHYAALVYTCAMKLTACCYRRSYRYVATRNHEVQLETTFTVMAESFEAAYAYAMTKLFKLARFFDSCSVVFSFFPI